MATKAYQTTGNAYQGTGQFAYQGEVGVGVVEKTNYTGPGPLVTASKNSPYLIGNPYRRTHNNGGNF